MTKKIRKSKNTFITEKSVRKEVLHKFIPLINKDKCRGKVIKLLG